MITAIRRGRQVRRNAKKTPCQDLRQAVFAFDGQARPFPFALCQRQSGDTSTRLEPQPEHTKRRAPAVAGKGVSGPSPIASKPMGVDRRQTGLQHVTHAPATPWDWRSVIVGGTMVRGKDATPQNRLVGVSAKFRFLLPPASPKRRAEVSAPEALAIYAYFLKG